ncbi:Ig-like domain-containing protein [Aeromonas veronii]|uniref:Ig-like domain-containing protein n=1 Tax=Aeromonas veronii TaxID=654 RepID=UPI001FFF1BAF|nr:Ig-like domain-containing protein [Aeromonas veronii]UPK54803.1 Ig-like domain-containing protein [Aeromonas veronii]
MGTGNSDDTAIDTQAPSVEVNIVDDLLSGGETSEVPFSFSEKVTGFDEGSLNRSGRHRHRSQEHRRWSDLDRYLHPDPGLYRLRQRDRNNGSYTDLNGNVGTGNSDDTAIDTRAPSVEVNIVDDLLSVGETSEVTFSFSEKVTGLTKAASPYGRPRVTDLKSTDGGQTWTGTFTPTPG